MALIHLRMTIFRLPSPCNTYIIPHSIQETDSFPKFPALYTARLVMSQKNSANDRAFPHPKSQKRRYSQSPLLPTIARRTNVSRKQPISSLSPNTHFSSAFRIPIWIQPLLSHKLMTSSPVTIAVLVRSREWTKTRSDSSRFGVQSTRDL